MLKKSISVLLAFLLVFSCFTVLPTSVGADSVEGTVSKTVTFDETDGRDYKLDNQGSMEIETAEPTFNYTYNYAGLINSDIKEDTSLRIFYPEGTMRNIKIKNGKAYRIDFWVMVTSTGLSGCKINLDILPNTSETLSGTTPDRTAASMKLEKNSSWVKKSLSFVATAEDEGKCFTFNTSGIGLINRPNFYIDDVYIYECDPVSGAAPNEGGELLSEWHYAFFETTENWGAVRLDSDNNHYSNADINEQLGDNTTKALHIKSSDTDYTNAVTLDYAGSIHRPAETIYSVNTVPGRRYKISWEYKFEDPVNTALKPNYFRFFYVAGSAGGTRQQVELENAVSKFKVRDNRWIRCEFEVLADEYTGILSFYFNLGKTIPVDAWVDNIKIEEITSAIIANTDLSYCENQYNLADDESINVPITVNSSEEYTFGADIVGNANDEIYLSSDGVNEMPLSDGVKGASVTATTTRYGARFIAPYSGTVYIVAKNNSGSLKLTDICLFKAKSTSTNIEMGKRAKPAETTYVSSMATLPESLSNAVNISINNNATPVNENFRGINGVYHLFNGLSDTFNRVYTEEQTNEEFDRLKDMGITMVRGYYGSGLTWDAENQCFDFTSPDFQRFVKNCKELEKRGIEVGISPVWSLKSLISSDIDKSTVAVNVNTGRPYGIYVDSDNNDTADSDSADYEATLANFSDFMKQTVLAFEEYGVTNVKYFFAFTECANTFVQDNNLPWSDMTAKREYDKLYPYYDKAITALDKGLKDAGLRDKYKIVSPCDNHSSEDDSLLVKYTIENLSDKVDIIGNHNGYCKDDEGIKTFNDDVFAAYAKSDCETVLKAANEAGFELWIDEYNVDMTDHDFDDPYKGTALGSMVTAIMNAGVSNAFLWTISDQQWPNTGTYNNDYFYNGLHKWGYMPSFFESYTPYKAWYACSLITKYIGQGTVYSTSDNSANHLYSSFIERNDGDMTLLAVNYDTAKQNVKFNFGKTLNGKTVYKYVYNPNDVNPTSDAVMIGASAKVAVSNSFYDTLNPGEVVIYTTKEMLKDGSTMDISKVVGTSIRLNETSASGENRSGIRFKSNIKNELLEECAVNGYTVVEYGTVVMRSDILGDYDLTLDTTVLANGRTYKSSSGVAYRTSSNTDVIFKAYDDSRDFTAVLYNIGYNKANETYNYDAYGRRYSARIYAKLKYADSEETVVVYDDDIQSASIFDVFYAIQQVDISKVTNPEQYANIVEDKEKVRAWLAWNDDIVAAYNAWLKKMGYNDTDIDIDNNPDF